MTRFDYNPQHELIGIQTRQEICEGTPWFKAYQSGVYHKDGVVHGYLLGGHGSRWTPLPRTRVVLMLTL
jgi:hypothetical protein